MHPDKTNATLEDLWPGDVVVVPYRMYGILPFEGPFRYVDTRKGCGGELIVQLRTLDGEHDHEVIADEGWGTRVVRLA